MGIPACPSLLDPPIHGLSSLHPQLELFAYNYVGASRSKVIADGPIDESNSPAAAAGESSLLSPIIL